MLLNAEHRDAMFLAPGMRCRLDKGGYTLTGANAEPQAHKITSNTSRTAEFVAQVVQHER